MSGHYHPKASVKLRARHFTGRCFVTDGRHLILPAFGAYAGGLDVLTAGSSKVYRFPKTTLRGLNAAAESSR